MDLTIALLACMASALVAGVVGYVMGYGDSIFHRFLSDQRKRERDLPHPFGNEP